MSAGIFDLAVILSIAGLLGILMRYLKQPVLLAYILTGLIIGFSGLIPVESKEVFRTFSELGVMFLLFLIGLEINYTSLRLVGRISVIVGLAQIIFTFAIGLLIALFFKFGFLESSYISIALTFSSTIIIIKLLSEKKDLSSLYGKITVGLLLVQDFLAILILIFLAGIQNGQIWDWRNIVFTVGKGAVLFSLTVWLGRKIIPLIFDKIAQSQELLFISSIAWCLAVVTLVMKAGFSIEIGGFLAGLALANSSENFEISSRIRSLRDFFIMIFFVILGSSLTFANLNGLTWPVIAFSIFVLIGNPLIVLIIMGILGYRKRTSFLCGVTVAQISEFSLILAALGLRLGHISNAAVSLITIVGIITITLSTYLIIYSEELFRRFNKYLSIFERRSRKNENLFESEFDKPIILVGSHRVGQNIAANLPKENLLIIDFDPEIVRNLKRQGYATLFGDISDLEIAEKANLRSAELIISTSPDFEDNLRLLREIKVAESKAKVIVRAENEEDAKVFYENKADYVILPHLTSGQYLGRSISVDPELKILEHLKKKDLESLGSIKYSAL